MRNSSKVGLGRRFFFTDEDSNYDKSSRVASKIQKYGCYRGVSPNSDICRRSPLDSSMMGPLKRYVGYSKSTRYRSMGLQDPPRRSCYTIWSGAHSPRFGSNEHYP